MLRKLWFECNIVWNHKTILNGQEQDALVPLIFLATVGSNNEPLWNYNLLQTFDPLIEELFRFDNELGIFLCAFLLDLVPSVVGFEGLHFFLFNLDFVSLEFCHIE